MSKAYYGRIETMYDTKPQVFINHWTDEKKQILPPDACIRFRDESGSLYEVALNDSGFGITVRVVEREGIASEQMSVQPKFSNSIEIV